MSNVILNIAAGRVLPLKQNYVFSPINTTPRHQNIIVNIDTMYSSTLSTSIPLIEQYIFESDLNCHTDHYKIFYTNTDANTFLETFIQKVDAITVYRYMEHIHRDQLLYFIYLMSCVLKEGGYVEVIVPNYETLALKILRENVNDPYFERHNILVTTELLNEPDSPHCSIWTPARAKKYFELEERFVVSVIDENFKFDGRDIYLYFKATRVTK